MKHLHIVIPEALHELLRKEAHDKNISLAEVVRQYLPGDVKITTNQPIQSFVPGEKITDIEIMKSFEEKRQSPEMVIGLAGKLPGKTCPYCGKKILTAMVNEHTKINHPDKWE